MKKRTSALLAIVTLSVISLVRPDALKLTAVAADTPNNYTFDETLATYDGIWVPFDSGFQLYVPGDWTNVEISSENADRGIIFQAQADDDSGWNMAVSINSTDSTLTIDSVSATLTSAGYTEVTEASYNNIPVITYQAASRDASGIAFIDDAGNLCTVLTAPASDSGFQSIAASIKQSVSVY